MAPSLGQAYHWPLDAPRALTSTFAEHRSGHFHSGIDLKTWGQVGHEVYAVGGGYVWRVRTSPWGYGKALYLRLEDGKTAVYGHLSDFSTTIQQVVEVEQIRLGRYSLDLYLQPDQIPVVEGQLVGFSGRTGCAHPHLHFEIRDEENCPLNPLQSGFVVADHRAPRMTTVSIKPLDWSSTVDGQRDRQLYPLRWNSAAGHYQLSSTPHVQGRVGLALAVHDLADGAQNHLGVYALYLSVDGQQVFSSAYDRFPFDDTKEVDLETDFALYQKGRGIYHNLYLAPGNELPFHQPHQAGSGVIDDHALEPGYHRIRIQAQDIWGNAGEAEFSLLVDQTPRLESLQIARDWENLCFVIRAHDHDGPLQRVMVEVSQDLGQSWEPLEVSADPSQEYLYRARWGDSGDSVVLVRARAEDQFGVRSPWRIGSLGTLAQTEGEPEFEWQLSFFHDSIEISIHSDRLLAQEPRVILNQTGGKPQQVSVYQEAPRRYRGLAALVPGLDGDAVISITGRDLGGHLGATGFSFPVYTITRSDGGKVVDSQGRIAALFQPGSVYQSFVARVEEVGASSIPGLPMKSQAFSLYPDDFVFEETASVFLSLPQEEEENHRIGLYRLTQHGKWNFVGRISGEGDGTIGARVKNFSTFALLEDQIPPLIWRLRPEENTRTRQKQPVLSAKLRDMGSGIGREEDVLLRLDGQKLISQYDPPVETVQARPRRPLALGEHLLEVVVRDRAGNESRAQSRFTIIP
jgi:hypothetical protein